MNAKYWQKGEALDFTPTEDVKNGSVVCLESRIGIAASDIKANEQGHVHVVGVFAMDKAEGKAVKMGTALYYDEDADNITTDATGNVPAGYAAADAAESDATVLVNIADVPATAN